MTLKNKYLESRLCSVNMQTFAIVGKKHFQLSEVDLPFSKGKNVVGSEGVVCKF